MWDDVSLGFGMKYVKYHLQAYFEYQLFKIQQKSVWNFLTGVIKKNYEYRQKCNKFYDSALHRQNTFVWPFELFKRIIRCSRKFWTLFKQISRFFIWTKNYPFPSTSYGYGKKEGTDKKRKKNNHQINVHCTAYLTRWKTDTRMR